MTILLTGHISRKETAVAKSGKVAFNQVACTNIYTKKDGTQVEDTQFINFAIPSKFEKLWKHLDKGQLVTVVGHIEQWKSTNEKGENRYTQMVVADSIGLGSAK